MPCDPATVMVTSFPKTCAQTIVSASAWVGLTLPGMMLEPGSFSGRLSSPSPERGPEPSQRTSLAIFMRLTASVRMAAVGRDERVVRGERRELVGGAREGQPGQLGDARRGRRTEVGAAH